MRIVYERCSFGGILYMRNHEVTQQQPLLKNGQIAEPGWSRKMVQEYNRADIKAPKFRIKEWDYYLIQNKEFAVALTVNEMGYMGMLSASFIKFNKKWEHTETELTAAPMGKFNMPAHTSDSVIAQKGEKSSFELITKDGVRHLKCEFNNFDGEKDFFCDITLIEPKQDSLVIATPFDKKNHFYYNHKINCMPASGWAEYDGIRYEFNPATDFGILDWGRGVWTYDNWWYWGSGSGYVDGVPVGFNIGYGFGNTSAASENIIFYNGVGHKIDDVTFVIPEDDYLKPWKFTSSDGRFEMDFEPIIDRNSYTDLKLIVSEQHQVFGKMTGTMILDDGTKVELKDFLCFAEKVHNKY